jgi:hypothetical protein
MRAWWVTGDLVMGRIVYASISLSTLVKKNFLQSPAVVKRVHEEVLKPSSTLGSDRVGRLRLGLPVVDSNRAAGRHEPWEGAWATTPADSTPFYISASSFDTEAPWIMSGAPNKFGYARVQPEGE